MITTCILEEVTPQEYEIYGSQDHHVGNTGAKQIAGSDIGDVLQYRADIGDQLGQRGCSGKETSTDPQPSPAGLLCYGIGIVSEPRGGQEDQTTQNNQPDQRDDRSVTTEELMEERGQFFSL